MTGLDIETKVEQSVARLLEENVEYTHVRTWDGNAPEEGLEIRASVEGQVSEQGRGAVIFGDGGNNDQTGVLWDVTVEVTAYQTKQTPPTAWRSVEEALGFPENLPAAISTDDLHIAYVEYDEPWRREVIDPFLVRTFSFSAQAGHLC